MSLLVYFLGRVEPKESDSGVNAKMQREALLEELDRCLHLLCVLSHSPPNHNRLTELQVTGIVIRLLRAFSEGGGEGGDDETVEEIEGLIAVGFEIIANLLSSPDIGEGKDGGGVRKKNTKQLLKEHGAKLLLELLSRHAASNLAEGRHALSLTGHGLRILSVLAMKNRLSLGEMGACELVMDLCKYFVPEHDRDLPLSVVATLTPHQINLIRAMHVNGEPVHHVEVIEIVDRMAQQVSTVIYNLSLSCPENKTKFMQADAMVHMLMLLKKDTLSVTTKHEIKDAINAIKY